MRIRSAVAVVTALCACAPPPPPPGPPALGYPDLPSTLPDRLRVQVEDVYYDVSGVDRNDLNRALAGVAPRYEGRMAFALTDWRVHWGYRPSPDPGACRGHRPEVTLQIETTLPRWNGRADAPAKLGRQWDAFVMSLRHHESFHRALVIESGLTLLRTLEELSARDCGVLLGEAEEAVRRIHEAYQDRHRAFDASSTHAIQPRW